MIHPEIEIDNVTYSFRGTQVDPSPGTSKSKKRKTVTDSRKELVKENKVEKSDRAAKKGMKDNFLTL